MNDPRRHLLLIFVLAVIIIMNLSPTSSVSSQSNTQTPTPDPFLQPPLSSNPTELELGRYLYWRHCMPCHGNRGQGLTDEFRALWEPEHQDCWARGCHGGRRAGDSFSIPTIVPPIAGADPLSQFESQQSLFQYLKATHPPQDPGFLTDEEYRTIVLFVFEMNHRPLAESTAAPSVSPTLNLPPSSQATQPPRFIPLVIAAGVFLIALFILLRFKAGITH